MRRGPGSGRLQPVETEWDVRPSKFRWFPEFLFSKRVRHVEQHCIGFGYGCGCGAR